MSDKLEPGRLEEQPLGGDVAPLGTASAPIGLILLGCGTLRSKLILEGAYVVLNGDLQAFSSGLDPFHRPSCGGLLSGALRL